MTGTNTWQPLTNITLGPWDIDHPQEKGSLAVYPTGRGPSPAVIQQPLTSTNRFYRGAWLPWTL